MECYELTANEVNVLIDAADHFAESTDHFDDEKLVKTIMDCQLDLRQSLPGIREFLYQQQRNQFETLRVDAIPEYQYPNIISVILASLLGTAIKEYEHGVWLKTVKSTMQLSDDMGRPSSKDCKDFYLHTDLSYTEIPPPLFMFHCLRNDNSLGGKSILCGLSNLVNNMSKTTYIELQKNQFAFPAPDYYEKSATVVHPILSELNDYGIIIRYRRDDLTCFSKAAINALKELTDLIEQYRYMIELPPNTLLFINNHKCLHGRQGYLLQYDKQRYFNQIYLTPDKGLA